MNAGAYLQVLQGHMLNFFHIHECEVFMQDSAPSNKAKKVKKFFGEHHIDLLEWRGNNPDMNSMENCWRKIEHQT